MTDPIRSLVNELSGFLGVYSHDMRYAAGNTNVAVLQEKLDAAKAALGVAQGPSDMTNPDALAERLAAETARADGNGMSCTELYKVLRAIIRNSPDAYAVKVATEALAMPWLLEQHEGVRPEITKEMALAGRKALGET